MTGGGFSTRPPALNFLQTAATCLVLCVICDAICKHGKSKWKISVRHIKLAPLTCYLNEKAGIYTQSVLMANLSIYLDTNLSASY